MPKGDKDLKDFLKDFDYNSITDMQREPLGWCTRCGTLQFRRALFVDDKDQDNKYCPYCWRRRLKWYVRLYDSLKVMLPFGD